jgi:hypothetical protein
MGESSALNSSYRFYFDQWGVKANTFKVSFLQEVNDEEDFYEVFARYHHQSKVRYYGETFNSLDNHMTSDSDMESFNAY